MTRVLRSDIYRFGKSKLLYGVIFFIALVSFLLTVMIRGDIRLGVSMFGNLLLFRDVNDILRMGIEYQNGLGFFIAIVISVFIGHEYQWHTWQNKWLIAKNRTGMYISKLICSSLCAVIVFVIYQLVVIIGSGQASVVFSYNRMVFISGIFIYATLGSVICLIAIVSKNMIYGVICSLCYVLFVETLVSLIGTIRNFSESVGRVFEWLISRSLFGLSTTILSPEFTQRSMFLLALNAMMLILIHTTIGLLLFRKQEL